MSTAVDDVRPLPSRVRWAAIGAAVAVSIGGGGLLTARATLDSGERSAFVPIAPCRLLDTRPGTDTVGTRSTPLGPGDTLTAAVRGTNGNCTIPNDAIGVSMNVVVANPTASSFLTVFPADVTRPLSSNLNWVANQAPTPNAVTADLSADGRVSFFNLAGDVNIAADIVGYYVDHTHDDRYYTKGETDGLVAAAGVQTRLNPEEIATLAWYDDPASSATVNVGGAPRAVAFDGTHVWVTNATGNSVQKVDRTTNAVVATVAVGANPRGIAFDGSSIWVSNFGTNTVSRINITTNAVTNTVTVGSGPRGIAFDGTFMWVANAADGSVSKINRTTNTAVATVAVGTTPYGVAFDGTSIYVTNNGNNTVSKVDPVAENETDNFAIGALPEGIVFDGRYLWVASTGPNTVTRVDPATLAVATPISVGADPLALAFDGTNLWVTTQSGGSVEKIYPAVNAAATGPTAGLLVGGQPDGIVFDGQNLWIADVTSGELEKIAPF